MLGVGTKGLDIVPGLRFPVGRKVEMQEEMEGDFHCGGALIRGPAQITFFAFSAPISLASV